MYPKAIARDFEPMVYGDPDFEAAGSAGRIHLNPWNALNFADNVCEIRWSQNIIGTLLAFEAVIGYCSEKQEDPMSRLKLLKDQRQLVISKLESLADDHPLRPRYLERMRELDDQIEALS